MGHSSWSGYPCTQTIVMAGKRQTLPAVQVGEAVIVVKGKRLKVAEIHDELWVESRLMPDPEQSIRALRAQRPRPDLYTFAQKLPEVEPRFSYRMEWDSVATLHVTSYKHWFDNQVNRNTRRNLAKASKAGVVARVVELDDALIEGVCSVYNESSVRQGKPFWHYGKSIAVIREEISSFFERARFIGAYLNDELIGFIKLTVDGKVAALLHIVSMTRHSDKSPTNALIGKAVELCEQEGLEYLLYDRYVYGNKTDSSLMEFKRRNGFEEINVPRYYVPITLKGRIALKLGLHRGLVGMLPKTVLKLGIALRARYYQLRRRPAPAADRGQEAHEAGPQDT
jgi:hypothetical protein